MKYWQALCELMNEKTNIKINPIMYCGSKWEVGQSRR